MVWLTQREEGRLSQSERPLHTCLIQNVGQKIHGIGCCKNLNLMDRLRTVVIFFLLLLMCGIQIPPPKIEGEGER